MQLSADLYHQEEDNVTSKLCSSYAWDTAMQFIEKQNSGWIWNSTGDNYSGQLGKTGIGQARNNIYDMGGNCNEITTEITRNTTYNTSARGGNFRYAANTDPAVSRAATSQTAINYISFRIMLYL